MIRLIIKFWIARIKHFFKTGRDFEKLQPPTEGYFRAYFCEPDRDGCTWRYHEMPLYLADKFNDEYKDKLVGLTREEVVEWILKNKAPLSN
jgi:hypothetical protein